MARWIAVVTLLFCSLALRAQQPVTEPEFSDVFVSLDAGKLIPLERQTAVMHAGGGGFIVASSKAAYEFPGDKSPVRFHSGQALEFVVRTAFASSGVDPNTLYVLRKLNGKKKSRELVFMAGRFSPFGGSVKTDPSQGAVVVSFSRYGAASLKATVGALAPGEYAIGSNYPQAVFCFGVD